jgi:hypothetical protein
MLAGMPALYSQINVTTYYVVPPTSGCNGVWAVSNSQSASCVGPNSSYNMNPLGCVQISGPVSGDTVFWPLCAFPCDLVMINSLGISCVCNTGTTTGFENPADLAVLTTYPNPATSADGWNIWFHEQGNAVTVSIYNAFGQLVSREESASAPQVLHVETAGLAVGTYIAEIAVDGGVRHERLVLTK